MSFNLSYNTDLSRVRIVGAALAVPTVRIERSTDQVRWTTVRGGVALTVNAGSITLDDYEFTPDVVNHYRAVTPSAVVVGTADITPDLMGAVWLKSLARPFLNRPISITDWGRATRPTRSGVFTVIGRSLPVEVNDVRGSRRWPIEVVTTTLADAEDMDYLLASGDLLLLHVPASWPARGGYVSVGETGEGHVARGSVERTFTLPLTEVAAPGPDIVGATSNWQTVLNTYPTWADVLAAYPTWGELLELVGSPSDVIVP